MTRTRDERLETKDLGRDTLESEVQEWADEYIEISRQKEKRGKGEERVL
jgi:hypothetical protein